jgi:homocysteine S-methyltransferase
MADFSQRYIALGARVVGGCCGSTPEHIAAIAQQVKA